MNSVSRRMRRDWNRRARSDALYYVALGTREQTWQEFLRGAEDLAGALELELRRLPDRGAGESRTALEIGCGPGRLMVPLSRHFAEIHGVDVSSEMVELARKNLAPIPNARVHSCDGTNLAQFSGEFFDFVYSFAVFQHIPEREVVLQYLKETRRVLRTGGVARLQLNGIEGNPGRADTWRGVGFKAAEIAEFARNNDFQLLALEGANTQYMWGTLRKRPDGWFDAISKPAAGPERISIRKITQASCSATVVPSGGRFAAFAVWIDGLPADADLNTIRVLVGGRESRTTYIGAPDSAGLQQVNACLPEGLATGLQPVQVAFRGACCGEAFVRLIPPPPRAPRVVSVTDGVFVGLGRNISSRLVRISIEETDRPLDLRVSADGFALRLAGVVCTDPGIPRFEVDFKIPASSKPGTRQLECRLGRRYLGSFEIVLAAKSPYAWLRRMHPVDVYQAARRFVRTRQNQTPSD
jgi:SAM-dependent methyltransferase